MLLEKLPKEWQEKWNEQSFSQPTRIQEKVFLPLKEGKNILGISPTGSGKTLAYLLPLLLNVQPQKGNQLLILLPTQELAMQVTTVAREWGNLLSLTIESLIGGANPTRQIERLKKKKPEILIGTPGRIYELIRTKKIQLMKIHTIVMDEADQLFADEKEKFTQNILSHAPKNYQLVFFSATGQKISEQVEKMTAGKVEQIDVTDQETSQGNVFHYYLKIPRRKRVETLQKLTNVDQFSALVFFNELSDLGTATEKLEFMGYPIASLASDQSKLLRQAALKKFRNSEIQCLFTTEILARGLDVKNLPYVVNFEPPKTPESYLHRAGRVGRMGVDGKILTFVQDETLKTYRKLLQPINVETSEITLFGGKLVGK